MAAQVKSAIRAAAAPAKPYELGDQIGHVLRRAHQRHAAIFAEDMGGLDLTPTQFAALVRIRDLAPVSQNLLGRATAMDPATIMGVIRRLDGRGLIARNPDPADRRLTMLSLSKIGQPLVARAVERGRAITEATLAPLAAEERRALLALLRKLI